MDYTGEAHSIEVVPVGNIVEIKSFCIRKYDEARKVHSEKLHQIYELTRDDKVAFATSLMETVDESEAVMKKYAARLRIEAKMRPLEATRADEVTIEVWDGSIA